jgi:hypothetical protein
VAIYRAAGTDCFVISFLAMTLLSRALIWYRHYSEIEFSAVSAVNYYKLMSEVESKSWNRTKVRCLASCRAEERPIAFVANEREIKVRSILESWREPNFIYFKVETDDRRVYVLRYHEHEDYWEMRESG